MAKKDGEWLGGKSRVERKKRGGWLGVESKVDKEGWRRVERRGVGWKGSGSRVKRRGEQGGQEGWRRAVWRGKAWWKGRMEEGG